MQQRGLRKFELGSAQRLILSAAKPRHASPQQPNGLSRGAPMRFNAHAKGGIKNLKGATELELNFSARRPIHGRLADVGAETVQSPAATPPGTCGPRRKGTLRLAQRYLVSVHREG